MSTVMIPAGSAIVAPERAYNETGFDGPEVKAVAEDLIAPRVRTKPASVSSPSVREGCSQDACWWRHRGRLPILHSIVVEP